MKTKTAACSGGLGDIVYSIPILRELNVKDVYIKESWFFPPYISMFSAIKRLLIYEGFNPLPTKGGYGAMEYEPGLKFDYDIDDFRKQPDRGRVFIPTNMRRQFELPIPVSYEPWLNMPVSEGDYTVIHLTERWRNGSKVDWRKILFCLKEKGKVVFTGFQHEWLAFCTKYGDVKWHPTNDVHEMTELIAGAKAVYCNQSVSLALSQGLGKTYYLEKKPGKTNTLMRTKNENILT